MMKRILILLLLLTAACSGEMDEPAAATAPPPTATMNADATPLADAVPSFSAADADVIFVRAEETAANVWTFYVTVAHPDTGWEDYADGWDVLLPDGGVLKKNPADPFTRLLLHPHETEQPFTRSQSGLTIPAGVTAVTVRAHDLVDGFGGREIIIDLSESAETEDFTVVRFSE